MQFDTYSHGHRTTNTSQHFGNQTYTKQTTPHEACALVAERGRGCYWRNGHVSESALLRYRSECNICLVSQEVSMPKVLVIDDEEGIRSLLDTLLSRKGYEVVLASIGQKRLQHFAVNVLMRWC